MRTKQYKPTGRRDGHPGNPCKLVTATVEMRLEEGFESWTKAINAFTKHVESAKKAGQLIPMGSIEYEGVQAWILYVSKRGSVRRVRPEK